MTWKDATFIGFVDGRPAATLSLVADPVPTRLQVVADTLALSAARDSVRVIVRALDQAGSIMPFLDETVTVGVHGPARLLGPGTVTLKGGTIGFWLETTGAGEISLDVASPRFADVRFCWRRHETDSGERTKELVADTGQPPIQPYQWRRFPAAPRSRHRESEGAALGESRPFRTRAAAPGGCLEFLVVVGQELFRQAQPVEGSPGCGLPGAGRAQRACDGRKPCSRIGKRRFWSSASVP